MSAETFVLRYSVTDRIPHFAPFHNFRFVHISETKFVNLASKKTPAECQQFHPIPIVILSQCAHWRENLPDIEEIATPVCGLVRNDMRMK